MEGVIERARGHDGDALAEIYRRYVRRVIGLCRYMLDSRESAEDATSEVFLKLQRSIESYDRSIPFPRWLLRVAGNQCIDVLWRLQRGRKVFMLGIHKAVRCRSKDVTHILGDEGNPSLNS